MRERAEARCCGYFVDEGDVDVRGCSWVVDEMTTDFFARAGIFPMTNWTRLIGKTCTARLRKMAGQPWDQYLRICIPKSSETHYLSSCGKLFNPHQIPNQMKVGVSRRANGSHARDLRDSADFCNSEIQDRYDQ